MEGVPGYLPLDEIPLSRDVPLWRVTVSVSAVELIVSSCLSFMKKGQEAMIISRIRPKVLAAFECSNYLSGSIYIQAQNPNDVLQGVAGISFHQAFQSIPVEEWASLVNLEHSDGRELAPWACVHGKGRYRGDLVHILDINPASKIAEVLLVPREDNTKGKKRTAPRHPSPCVFDPKPGLNLEQLSNGRVWYNGKVYHNGLIEQSIPLANLRASFPSISEAEIFGGSGAIKMSVMVRLWSELASASVVPGSCVQIMAGEQAGLIGKVLEVAEGAVKCVAESSDTVVEVPVNSVRLYFREGDYIQVIMGAYAGKSGGIIKVERDVSMDIITFIDDASVRDKGSYTCPGSLQPEPGAIAPLPEKVSFSHHFHDFSHIAISPRLDSLHTSSRIMISLSSHPFSPNQAFQHLKNLLMPSLLWTS